MTTPHAISNLENAKDLAPEYVMEEMGEARFLRQELGAERIGISHYRMNPGRRVGFGRRHGESEEIYVVLAGAGRFKVDDEIVDVAVKDVVYCPPSTMREWEAGPDGLEILAFGGHAEDDSETQTGWWTD